MIAKNIFLKSTMSHLGFFSISKFYIRLLRVSSQKAFRYYDRSWFARLLRLPSVVQLGLVCFALTFSIFSYYFLGGRGGEVLVFKFTVVAFCFFGFSFLIFGL